MIGFISNNFMLPILDFFYGIVHSYGFAIIALTLIVRFALYPLSAGQIRNMRRMKIAQPAMQKKVKEVQERYKNDPVKQREEMSKVYQEYGNPLAGCLPLIVQMPILFALFATLRGSPFADVNYTFDIRAFPQEQVEAVAPETCEAKEKTLYIRRDNRATVHATLPNCDRLGIGQSIAPSFIDADGTSLAELLDDADREFLQPRLHIDKGDDVIQITEAGEIEAIGTGDAAVTVDLPGLAKDDGFLFIEALGRVGAVGDGGEIHWDIVGMVLFFGASLYVNQLLSGSSKKTPNAGAPTEQEAQQETIQKLTPILFSGMFLFFPLPAGVLMYMAVANVFQTAQTFVLSREPLPENLQKILEEQEKQQAQQGREALPFEKKRSKKKEKTSG